MKCLFQEWCGSGHHQMKLEKWDCDGDGQADWFCKGFGRLTASWPVEDHAYLNSEGIN
jgi:hypothetical protein